MKRSIIIQAWLVHKSFEDFFLPYTHYIYLVEIAKYFDEVCLLSPVKNNIKENEHGLVPISSLNNVYIKELPYSDSYKGAIEFFFNYVRAYHDSKNFDVAYCRFPTPFGWLQKLYLKNSARIIHYVGDPIDAANNNPNFSRFKKIMYTSMFFPENLMYYWACDGASVFTNGSHIASKLKSKRINATPLISSTLRESDYYYDSKKMIDINFPKLVYVGYLRKAKGVETIIKSFKMFVRSHTNAKLTIVGSGEYEKELIDIVKSEGVRNVNFLGHIDDRNELNEILRSHDIFCFASLSEGSPRVILEAMANGINVISTPVGSLPSIFDDQKEIIFTNFNDPEDFSKKINSLYSDINNMNIIRQRAFDKIKEFTVERFVKTIFSEN